jgi:geranylgeranyl diphosphate synthase type II
MQKVSEYLRNQQAKVNNALQKFLPAADTQPALIHEAIRYTVFAGGKRIRPILCLAACEALGGNEANAMPTACAIEIYHTSTLIHDDLPCMDDDDLRRGQPTCHIKYGEANAVLTGDAQMILAFELAAQSPNPAATVTALAKAAGSQGVIGGQIVDLASEGQPADAETLDYIHLHKTADLIRVSLELGAICAHASIKDIAALREFGDCIGLAFQIIDDILDVTADQEKLGKPIGSDEGLDKLTYVRVHGMEAARAQAKTLTEQADAALDTFTGEKQTLRAIASFLLARDY